MFGFGGGPKPKDEGRRGIRDEERSAKRDLRRSERETERELRGLEREEARVTAEIRQAAKRGDQKTVKTLAKQIVNIRKGKERLQTTGRTMRGLQTQVTLQAATARSGAAMARAADIMKQQNNRMMESGAMEGIRDFARMSEAMNMNEEMMDDMLADAFDDDEEEEDEFVGEVLAEIGLEREAAMPSAAAGRRTAAPAAAAPAGPVAAGGGRGGADDAEVDAFLASIGVG